MSERQQAGATEADEVYAFGVRMHGTRSAAATGEGLRIYDWALLRMKPPESQEYACWLLLLHVVSHLTELAYSACGEPPAARRREAAARYVVWGLRTTLPIEFVRTSSPDAAGTRNAVASSVV